MMFSNIGSLLEEKETKPTYLQYEVIPSSDKANWALYSMQSIEKITLLLREFPKDQAKRGCSATLAWTGEEGYNIPVECFGSQPIGILLNPNLIDVPQADLKAFASGAMIYPEILKKGAISKDDKNITYTSKYPTKAGYIRNTTGDFITNLARNEHITGKQEAIYHPVGTAYIFAKNIWRKYFKNSKQYFYPGLSLMSLNEAIVFRNSEANPIDGLFITRTPKKDEAFQLLKILKDRPSLNLYFYDNKLKLPRPPHILRFIDNQSAQSYLQGNLDFSKAFTKASPFKGFPQPDKITLFKKIYSTARNNQLGWSPLNWSIFNWNFLKEKENNTDTELQRNILDHIIEYPNDLVAKSWKLVESITRPNDPSLHSTMQSKLEIDSKEIDFRFSA